jgi:regulatory protein
MEILVDGEPWKKIHRSIFGRSPTFAEPLEQTFFLLERKGAKAFAWRQLAKQSQTSFSLKKALKERFVSNETIHETIQELMTSGYLDDEEWISQFVLSQKRKLGARAILQKCMCKGIPQERVVPYLEALNPAEDLLAYVQKKYKKVEFSDKKERDKAIRHLLGKGFSFDAIKEVIFSRNS